jgi:hypothetical protein
MPDDPDTPAPRWAVEAFDPETDPEPLAASSLACTGEGDDDGS